MELEQLNIIATFFGALVALIIFNQWKNQKGSEVISNEAKEIFNLVEKIPSKRNSVMEDMLKMSIHNNVPNDFDGERFTSFRDINIDIIKRLQLIKFKNKNKTTLKIINDFEVSYINFAKLYHQSIPIGLEELIDNNKKYEKNCTELKNDMYEYSLYIKTL